MKKFLTSLLLGMLCLYGVATIYAAEASGPPLDAGGFQWLDALVLGIVEGVTEYLPVSSTGHLLLAQHIMGLNTTEKAKEAADAYAIIIQVGAILAVLGLYRRRIGQMVQGLVGRDPKGLQLALVLLLAFIPAAVVGLAFGDIIKTRLFGPWPVVFGWLAGGIAILVKPDGRGGGPGLSIEDIRWRQALIIGLFQVLSMWPGISRSLATIMGGMIAGLALPAALEFSFLLGLITLGAATTYEMMDLGGAVLTAYGVTPPLVGVLASFAAAWLSVKWLLAYVRNRGLALFGYYRVLLAMTTGVLLLTGVL